MARAVLFDAEAREGLKRGMDTLANVVRVTLGPKGSERHPRAEVRLAPRHQ